MTSLYRLGVLLVAGSLVHANARPKASPAVSLLFQNDGNWTDTTKTTKYWVSTGDRTKKQTCSTPLGSSHLSQAHTSEELPFLCTNSAPHTTKVDTDFSASPKTNITSNGVVYTGTRDHLTFRFMGIPYAQPPVGPSGFNIPSRGCDILLTLHVYTPYIPSSKSSKTAPALKPVLFWIHGGGNTQGTGEDATFDGGPLVSRTDSVVVTIDHRLNIFGYLGLDDSIKGNYAIADKVAALQWSAGGSSVIELVKTPKAHGLFSAAISQSGGAGAVQNYSTAAAAIGPALDVYCNSTGAARLACLQALPAETILNITNTVTTWVGVLDGVYVLNDSVSQVSQGPSGVNSVPYMAGFMPEEGQSLLGTTITPNMTDFDPASVVGADLGAKVLASGLWNITDSFTPYNATVNVFTDDLLTCSAEEMITAAAKTHAFPSLYVYEMQRAYALSYYNPYNLCTFPAGNDELPYYRCHSGDLYEVFGTYHIFDQPIRNVRDIEYTTMIQDMWASFARTGNPNPPHAYLEARGYQSTLDVLSRWTWPQYTAGKPVVAKLQYPGLETGALPDIARISSHIP
ncbi:alpha/beta-hydrolase [Mycena olivaceomarginata]|nr:alpha/beta-hydrolase [Mycena olivaceomarginata]